MGKIIPYHKRSTKYRTEFVSRWSPKSPKVRILLIEKVLNRHVAVECGESRMVCALLATAIGDCMDRSVQVRDDARHWLRSQGFAHWCHLVGLDPDFVRGIADKAGYLASGKEHWREVARKVPINPKEVTNADNT